MFRHIVAQGDPDDPKGKKRDQHGDKRISGSPHYPPDHKHGGEENIEAASNAIIDSIGEYVYFIATPNSSEIESAILEMLQNY